MEWSAEGARRQVWAERLRRFARSGLTVAAFCERERISVPSFYQWRRKLGGRADGRAGKAQNAKSAQTRGTAAKSGGPTFVPLQITQSAAVEMRLPNGVKVWLPAGDAETLASAIAAAGSLAATGKEAEAC